MIRAPASHFRWSWTAFLLVWNLAVSCTPDQQHPNVADIEAAEHLTGVPMTPEERALMLADIRSQRQAFDALHELDLPNGLPPALVFDPRFEPEDTSGRPSFEFREGVERPERAEDIAFLSVAELGALLRQGQTTSVELTELYLSRIERYDPDLRAVITVADDLARTQAERADEELTRGIDRGPLHGIPYGLKDLAAVSGYPTTWGAMPYRDQVLEVTATVAARLEEAGAVLVAKTSVGALAWGDVWFGGQARTPWDVDEGASGSSAGSAAGVAAGLFPVAIGTETYGSIVSPAVRNGVTGLRPTFGTVSRHGVMALSWSMDKVGVLCRWAEDCAMVYDAIRGPDGEDPTVEEAGFDYDPSRRLDDLRVGYLETDFAGQYPAAANDRRILETLTASGVSLEPVSTPDFPTGALQFILVAEAAAAFDTLTRSGQDDLMVRQIQAAWPNVFRAARFIPAVEYIQANRVRTDLVETWKETMSGFDLVVAPCFQGDQLLSTNLAGLPSIAVPSGLGPDGLPTGTCLIGPPFGEAGLVTAAREIQAIAGSPPRPPGY